MKQPFHLILLLGVCLLLTAGAAQSPGSYPLGPLSTITPYQNGSPSGPPEALTGGFDVVQGDPQIDFYVYKITRLDFRSTSFAVNISASTSAADSELWFSVRGHPAASIDATVDVSDGGNPPVTLAMSGGGEAYRPGSSSPPYLAFPNVTIDGSNGFKLYLTTSTVSAEPYTFVTLSGFSGLPISGPRSVAVDGAGNVYVADTFNHVIRKRTPSGVVTTLAGLPGNIGGADGTGSAARFNYPYGVAVDGTGNVYVADVLNFTIRKITPSGVVTTLAGLAANLGSVDGTGSGARFNQPYSVAVGGGGDLYVADTFNHTIRKVTSQGTVTTVAGLAGAAGSTDGTGTAARFNNPASVAVDGAGNVYVADLGNYTIRKVTPAGVVTTLAGLAGALGDANGTGSEARFGNCHAGVGCFGPSGVSVDSAGNVYVADTYNHTIRKVTPAGLVTTLAGRRSIGNVDGTGNAASFSQPNGVAVDVAGTLYVADTGNSTIRKGYLDQVSSVNLFSTSPPGLGFTGDQFGFVLTGPKGQKVVVETSVDLTTWQPRWTNTFAGPLNFTDTLSGGYSNRYYRAHSP